MGSKDRSELPFYSYILASWRAREEAARHLGRDVYRGCRVAYEHGSKLIWADVLRVNRFLRVEVRGVTGAVYWLDAENIQCVEYPRTGGEAA